MSNNLIAENIKKFRKEKGFTQKELALKSGITRESLGNYERGTRTPPANILASIANALDKTTHELITGESLFGAGRMKKTLNDILNSGIYQSTNCRMDKKIILMDYIKRFLEDKYINLNTSEIIEICDFLTPVIDPLLKHKVDEILGKHNKEK